MQPNQTDTKTVQQTEGGGTVVSSALLGELKAALLDAKEKGEWAGNEDDYQTWDDANKDIGALTRAIEIIKRRSPNSVLSDSRK